MPAGTLVRVRSIHAQNRDTDVGLAGERCALNLAGIEKTALKRGDWLADPRALAAEHPDRRASATTGRGRDDDEPCTAAHSSGHGTSGCPGGPARMRPTERGCKRARATGVRCADLRLAGRCFHCPRCAGAAHHRRRDRHRSLRAGAAAPRRRAASLSDSIERLLTGAGVEPLLRNAPQGLEMCELARLCGRAPDRIAMPSGVRMIDAAGERFAFSNRTGAHCASVRWKRCGHFTRSNRTNPALIVRAFGA